LPGFGESEPEPGFFIGYLAVLVCATPGSKIPADTPRIIPEKTMLGQEVVETLVVDDQLEDSI